MPSIMERLRAFIRPTVVQISLGSDAPTQVLNYTAKTISDSGQSAGGGQLSVKQHRTIAIEGL